MSNILIMTDSASDISTEDEKKYNIPILPIQVAIGGKSYASRIDLDNEQFYALMAQHDEIPKTSQITPFEFQDVYLREAKNGVTDLILVLINSKGSSTYDNSCMAKELFFDEHPEYKDTFRIYNIDGRGYNALYGAPVVYASRMKENGASAQEIVSYLTGLLPRRQLYFGIYELKYASKSGRIPTAAAFLGDKLNLKPVMKIFGNEITTAAKCRGEKRLISKIVEMSLADMEPGSAYEVVYGCDHSCRDEVAQAMTEALGYGPAGAYQIGAAVSANAGPKVAGVCITRKRELDNG